MGPFPHSRFGHFQCSKQKSKATSQENMEIWPQKTFLTTGKWLSHEKSEKKGPNFLGRHGPILRLTFSESF